jgi:alpha-tubulin suppressor-like RCC1 family protein
MKSLIKTSALAIGLAAALGATAAEAQLRVMLPINPGVALMASEPEVPADPQEPEQEPLNDWSLLASDLPDGDSHSAYSFDFATLLATDPVDYALSDINWSADTLPDWLEIDPATGALSGTPPTYGETSFTVSADHAEEGNRQQGYTITINGVPLEVTQVSAGDSFACAITVDGAAKCWGANNYGQLGNGETTISLTPVDVVGLNSGVTAINVGIYAACAVHNGAAKCWGGINRLGNGTSDSSSTPVNVTGLTAGVSMISVGYSHICAVHNSAAKCWGYGGNGQLGNGSTNITVTPVSVTGLTSGVTAISSEGDHSCAIHNGAAKCWGYGGGGRLGNNGTANSSTAVNVTGLTSGVKAITAGGGHSCAITSANALRCWGINTSGQLGNGGNTDARTPVNVTGLTSGVTMVHAGSSATCAIHNGAAKCWGNGSPGMLGNGATTSTSTPVNVAGLSSAVSKIEAGSASSCAVHSGIAKCWGTAGSGRLGNGKASGIFSIPETVIH